MADSVFDYRFLVLKHVGTMLFRDVFVGRDCAVSLAPGGIDLSGSSLQAATAASRDKKVRPSDTGSIWRISEEDDVSCKARASSLLDARAWCHSRMEKTAFLKENRTEDRDICAGELRQADEPFVAAKRERNSMKPLMRQTLKDCGQDRISPESMILVGTSMLTVRTDSVAKKNCGGL
nr:hypothetical protein [uncultured Roseibium sp.]